MCGIIESIGSLQQLHSISHLKPLQVDPETFRDKIQDSIVKPVNVSLKELEKKYEEE